MTRNAEALFQTPEQRSAGTVTYRVYLDGAWWKGRPDWKNLPQNELILKLEEVYFTPKWKIAITDSAVYNNQQWSDR